MISKAIIIFNRDLMINLNNGWSLTGPLACRVIGNAMALKQNRQLPEKLWKIEG